MCIRDRYKIVPVLVGRQSGKPQNTLHDLVAMVFALLGIYIEAVSYTHLDVYKRQAPCVIGRWWYAERAIPQNAAYRRIEFGYLSGY